MTAALPSLLALFNGENRAFTGNDQELNETRAAILKRATEMGYLDSRGYFHYKEIVRRQNERYPGDSEASYRQSLIRRVERMDSEALRKFLTFVVKQPGMDVQFTRNGVLAVVAECVEKLGPCPAPQTGAQAPQGSGMKVQQPLPSRTKWEAQHGRSELVIK